MILVQIQIVNNGKQIYLRYGDISEQVSGVFILDSQTKTILAVSIEEKDFVPQLLETYLAIPPEQKHTLKLSDENYLSIMSICNDDKRNGTYNFWNNEKEKFLFTYPFNTTEFNSQLASLFVKFYLTKFLYQMYDLNYKSFISKLFRTLITKYSIEMDFEHFDEIESNHKKLFIKSIKGMSMRLTINNRRL